MKDPNRILEKISDIGDTVGEALGDFFRSLSKRTIGILVVIFVGTLVFLWAVLTKAFNKKKGSTYE